MTRAAPRKRGRPRAYDPDDALRRARDTFWRNGYAGTSLDDLAVGMAMNRPSIYAAFGDKRALYRTAVRDYAAFSRAQLASTLAEPRSLRDGLIAVYQGARDFYLTGDSGARGCFLMGTAVTEATVDEQSRTVVDATMTAFTEEFAQRFERAERAGELAPHPPDALAAIATATLTHLAIRARTGASPSSLDALITATVDVICARPA